MCRAKKGLSDDIIKFETNKQGVKKEKKRGGEVLQDLKVGSLEGFFVLFLHMSRQEFHRFFLVVFYLQSCQPSHEDSDVRE